MQPRKRYFPVTKDINEQDRSFHSEWYSEYNWLEYSVQLDAAFCFCCRLFPNGKMKKMAFTSGGVRNWQSATGKFRKHAKSEPHLLSLEAWTQYRANQKELGETSSVKSQLSAARQKLVRENRHYIKTMMKCIRFAAVQEIALRGHDECTESENVGNFKELMRLVSEHDEIVLSRLTKGPQNAVYTSPEVQNEVVNIMAQSVQLEIAREVSDCGVFALLADESRDVSKKEQLSIFVRTVVNFEVVESFLGFFSLQDQTAKSIADKIKVALADCHIDFSQCVAQTYDGASTMSGCRAGVSALLLQVMPKAIFTHCYNHRLNLVLVGLAKQTPAVANFYVILQRMYNFVRNPTVHAKFVDAQRAIGIAQPYELKSLSDTRWACR